MAKKALWIEMVAENVPEDKFVRLFQKWLLLSLEKRGLITEKNCRAALRVLEEPRP
jgi:hypothetical protein